MADQFTALSDLKSAFGKFGDMSDLLDRMRGRVDEINAFNKNAAGDDDIGKQYHQTVDKPTADLTDLLDGVRKAIDKVGQHGQDSTDQFNSADQDNTDSANAF
ncbi:MULTISPECIES: hypothetical protein [Kitasatospora]|uniref:hypothetical protein n=1 Tax=Kitasatospora TaxID=2063 RepID=UPI000C711036|nr:hypothetical protein [Kitasatospora sp. GP30]MDH6143817.1 hypothetical protein [Kitasatospora sp. GP30]